MTDSECCWEMSYEARYIEYEFFFLNIYICHEFGVRSLHPTPGSYM